MEISFEKAMEQDAADLIKVLDLSFRDDFIRFGECPGYKVPIEAMKKRIRDSFQYKIVLGARIIGNISVRAKGENRYWLGCLAVIPEFQNQGIGTKAIEFIENEFPDAISWGLDTPIQKTENCYFYEKMGFAGTRDEVHSGKVTLRIFEKKMERSIA